MALLPYQPARARFSDILLAIKAQIILEAVVAPGMIQIISMNTPPNTKAEQAIFMRPQRATAAQNKVSAAGRLHLEITRTLDVFIFNRVSVDAVNSNEVFLTDPVRGILDVEDDLLSALQDFLPTDSSGNNLLVMPMRMVNGTPENMDSQNLGWGSSSLSFEIVYMPPISLATISPDTIPGGVAGDNYDEPLHAAPVGGANL